MVHSSCSATKCDATVSRLWLTRGETEIVRDSVSLRSNGIETHPLLLLLLLVKQMPLIPFERKILFNFFFLSQHDTHPFTFSHQDMVSTRLLTRQASFNLFRFFLSLISSSYSYSLRFHRRRPLLHELPSLLSPNLDTIDYLN